MEVCNRRYQQMNADERGSNFIRLRMYIPQETGGFKFVPSVD